jgi:hypothetical protein
MLNTTAVKNGFMSIYLHGGLIIVFSCSRSAALCKEEGDIPM